MWTSTTSGTYHGGYTYGTGPWVDAYRTADGAIVHRGYTYDPDKNAFSIDIPSMWPSVSALDKISELDWYKLNGIDIRSEEEIPNMKTESKADWASRSRRYAVTCDTPSDLSQERILKCLSIMKSRLMMQCAPVKVENIECRMTPEVKENIVKAYRRLEMYGKQMPFVARFDEFMRPLPDEIRIDTMRGMTINIVDPSEYGPLYLEFEGVIRDIL